MSSAVDALIDAAYATALDFRVGGAFAAAYHAVSETELKSTSLSNHIARAREIAASRARTADLELPRMVINTEDGGVQSTHPIFRNLLDGTHHISMPGAEDLIMPASWKDVAVWVANCVSGVTTDKQLHASFVSKSGTRESAIMTLHPHHSTLDLVFLAHSVRSEAEEVLLLQRMLGLTERQATVARHIAQGHSATEIAHLMKIKPHTVRDHIKAIYERTDLNKQTDLAVLVGQLNLMAFKLGTGVWGARQDEGSLRMRMTNFFWTKSGRRVTFSDCGDKNGRLILKTHASLGGRWTCEKAARTLCKYGLRLIKIERPGIAMTDPAEGDRDETSVTDMLELLDHLDAKQVFAMGTGVGSFYIAEAISRQPERFTGACFLTPRASKIPSTEPNENTSLVESVGTLPMNAAALILESAANNKEFGGWEGAIRLVLKDSKSDLASLEDPELLAMHVRQQRSVTSEGFEGQATELRNYKKEMRRPPMPDIPYSIVYGDDDPIAKAHKGGLEWAKALGVKPKIVKDAGQLVFLTDTEDVLRAAGLIATQ